MAATIRVFFLAKTLEAIGSSTSLFALYVGITQPHGMGREFEIHRGRHSGFHGRRCNRALVWRANDYD